jgi:hypothetical protein
MQKVANAITLLPSSAQEHALLFYWVVCFVELKAIDLARI